jgi:hypothetical protein
MPLEGQKPLQVVQEQITYPQASLEVSELCVSAVYSSFSEKLCASRRLGA